MVYPSARRNPDWREALSPEYDDLPDEDVGSIVQGAVRGAQIGTALGPVGAVVGALGGAAISGIKQQGGLVPAKARIVSPVSQDANAAAQLLQVILHPDVIKALMALSLGDAGRRSVALAGKDVPTGAIASTVETLAGRAVEAYNAALANDTEEIFDAHPEYDPANPDEHADYILSLLSEADATPADASHFFEDANDEDNPEVWTLYEGKAG